MRVIIAGSRGMVFSRLVHDAMYEAFKDTLRYPVTTVLCGDARGADRMGELWAKERGIPVVHYPADWDRYGKSAGYVRNSLMADNADALVAIWDGQSRGTKHMIDLAKAKRLSVYIHRYNEGESYE